MMRETDFEYVTQSGEYVPAIWMGDDDIVVAYGHVTHEEISEWARSMLLDVFLEDEFVDPAESGDSSHHWALTKEVAGEQFLDITASKSDLDAIPVTYLRL